MEQQYTYPTRWEKNIVSIIHIYRARAILLLFYDCQDTEYESHEIYIRLYVPIFTHRNIKGSFVQKYL